eukprot:TRINITY_DN6322_c0_g1_i1.p1 TRINITY_DN6322_c0_g1~~TRINITY_DN6322_c0_g1_i1.p1  ORF type:complete len:686 (-),score=105.25 TRINITY_DN6322_c0_g1_i1:247-2304(-)
MSVRSFALLLAALCGFGQAAPTCEYVVQASDHQRAPLKSEVPVIHVTDIQSLADAHIAACTSAPLDRGLACCHDVSFSFQAGFHILSSPINITFPLGESGDRSKTTSAPSFHFLAGTNQSASPSLQDLPAIVGGVPIPDNAWQPCSATATADAPPCSGWTGVFAARVTDIPSLNGTPPVRMLWADGGNLRIPRAAATGTPLAALKLSAVEGGDFPGFFAAAGVPDPAAWVARAAEMRWPRVIRNWIEPRCVVTSANATHLRVDPLCWKRLRERHAMAAVAPPAIDNVPLVASSASAVSLAPPSPGTFVSTGSWVFYHPPQTPTDARGGRTEGSTAAPRGVWAPVLESLLTLTGGGGHSLERLAFRHTTWRRATQPGGYIPQQSGSISTEEVQAAVTISRGTTVVVRGCAFAHLGSIYALEVGAATHGAVVDACVFQDLSGGGPRFGNVDNKRAVSPSTADWDLNISLTRSLVEDAACEYRGAVAVFAGYVRDLTIETNTVNRTGYTGISAGWGWGRVISWMRGTTIMRNHVGHVMQALNDGGCIYTLGPQDGSVVEGNVCHIDDAPVIGSLYHDNGSRGFVTTNNVVDGSTSPCVYLQGCCGQPAHNITVSNLWYRDSPPPMNHCAPQGCVVQNATVHAVPHGQAFPPPAARIMAEAGIPAADLQAWGTARSQTQPLLRWRDYES